MIDYHKDCECKTCLLLTKAMENGMQVSEELKELWASKEKTSDIWDAFRYGAAMMIDKKIEESIMSEGDGGMDKVVLTVEQEKAIKSLAVDDFWDKQMILNQHIKGWSSCDRKCLNELDYGELKRVINDPNSYVVIDSVQEKRDEQHLNHLFYKTVDEITTEVAKRQILKGAAKYDEPFDPDSWTGEELGNHALEELRDGQVYVVGLVEKIKGLEQENERLKEELYSYERGIFKDQKVEALIKENRKLTDRLTTIDKNSYVHLRKEIEDLRKVLSKLYVSYDAIWDEKAGLEDEVERLKEEKLKYLENGI